MNRISASEARARFGELLDRVQRGEEVAVFRKGQHVATLIPPRRVPEESENAVERIMARREKIRRDGRGMSLEEILEARHVGD